MDNNNTVSPGEAWLRGGGSAAEPSVYAQPSPGEQFLLAGPRVKREPIEVDATKLANTGRPIATFFDSMASGATFGGANKLNAFLDSLWKGTKYEDEVKARTDRSKVMAEEYPKTAFTGELAGGLATGVPAGAPLMAAKSIPLLGRLALTGGVAGGLTGAGHSEAEDWQGVAQDASKGFLLGGALAPVLGVAGNALTRGGGANMLKAGLAGAVGGGTLGAIESGGDLTTTGGMALGGAAALPALAFGGNKALTAATDFGGKVLGKLTSGANSYAARKIEEALARGEMTPAEAKAILDKLGPESALIDVPNPNVRMLGESVANTPGKPAKMAEKFFNERDAREYDAVRESIRKATGQPANYYDTAENLEKMASTKASPLYKEAYAANQQVESDAVNRILETDAGKEALREAARRMSNRMALMSKSDPELTALKNELVSLGKMEDPGRIGKGLKLETLDLVKREIDDMWLSAKKRAGQGVRGAAGEARDLNDLRRSFVKALDDADVTAKAGPNSTKAEGGAYARARQAYAGPTHAQDLMEEGLEFAKHPPEVLKRKMAEMSPSDRDFFKHGVTRALDNIVDNVGEQGSEALAVLKNKGMHKKMEAILGSEWPAYRDAILARREFAKTHTDVMKNSKTARRQNAKEDADTDTHPLIELFKGKPMNALASLASNIGKGLTKPSEAQIAELGPLLFDPAMKDTALHLVGSRANYNALVNKYLNLPVDSALAVQSGAYAGSSGQRP